MTHARPLFDAAASAGGGAFGDLPDWDLSDLYTAPEAPEFAADMDRLAADCAAFAATYEGKLALLDASGLLACVRAYEAIDILAGRLMSFAGLRYYQNTMDSGRAKFMADAQDRVTEATTALVFFSLEFNRLEDDHLARLLADSADLARYRPVFDRMRAMRPHQLSDELERFLHDQSTVGAAAWNRLFDETMAGMEFAVAGEAEALNLEPTLNLLTDTERARREAAARALAEGFGRKVK
ncbi:MAG TPA: oligoendopeptidase F, partial [Paracoccaceae bacterium]|nr:oligoendopeptidase F [Paracoccaceae bacterium]